MKAASLLLRLECSPTKRRLSLSCYSSANSINIATKTHDDRQLSFHSPNSPASLAFCLCLFVMRSFDDIIKASEKKEKGKKKRLSWLVTTQTSIMKANIMFVALVYMCGRWCQRQCRFRLFLDSRWLTLVTWQQHIFIWIKHKLNFRALH